MNKIYIALLFLAGLFSCTKEDDLKPSGARDDYFTILSDATPELKLRKEFYEQNGVHLLFNDTLRHEQDGTYADGTPYYVTETIDLGYSLTALNTQIQWTLLTDYEDQKKAADLVVKYILPHMTGSMKPYSVWMLQDLKLFEFVNWFVGSQWVSKNYYSGMRCLALNYGKMALWSDEEAVEACQNIFYDLIYGKIKDLDIPEFYAFCEKYYWEDLETCGYSGESDNEEEALKFAYQLGFLECFEDEDWDTGEIYYYFQGSEKDLQSYLKLLLTLKDDEDWKEWEIYPIIYQKLEILKDLIEGLGYKF